jgi:hypothetical protein
MRARLGLLVLLVAVVAGGAPEAAPAGQERPRAAKLVRFESCGQLARFARRNIVQTGGVTGVPFRGGVVAPEPLRPVSIVGTREQRTDGAVQPVSAPGPQDQSAVGGGTPEPFSTTNVQESGVDEADLVKTDGQKLHVVTDSVLRTYDVTGPVPRLAGRLQLAGTAHQLLLRGTRLLVVGSGARPGPGLPIPVDGGAPSVTGEQVLLTEVDVSNPAAPAVARTMELPGVVAGVRLTGRAARVVVASSPPPIQAESPAALERRAARARLSRFLPRTTIRSRISRRTFRRPVVGCADVRRPRAFSGLDLLSVLTIDLDRGLFSVERSAIMAGAQLVYASPASLVVASRAYERSADGGADLSGGATELHQFDAGAEPVTAYRGSGRVPGFVLNQFSMSEHAGVLRVATTEDAPFADDGSQEGESVSGVSVLRLAEGRLTTVGRVTGLGRGERIYAVRFMGDRGYVVTFRQVDPLYTLDLRDPAAPKVAGELKVAGFSAYLHPISETLLLGVGQDATEQGAQLGPQVSLFDVADPAQPRLVGRASLATSGSSAAEQDHHAFLWWAPSNLAVLPLDSPDGDRPFAGAVGFRVVPGGVAEIGQITHPAPEGAEVSPPIGRSVVIGDRLLTLSSEGIATSRLADLAPLAFTELE